MDAIAAPANQATLAWSRMETQFASTRAHAGETMSPTRADPTRRTLSVLPLVETDAGGEVRLVHDPRDRYRSPSPTTESER